MRAIANSIWVACAALSGAVVAMLLFVLVAVIALGEIEFHGDNWKIIGRLFPILGLVVGAAAGIWYLRVRSFRVSGGAWVAAVVVGVLIPSALYLSVQFG